MLMENRNFLSKSKVVKNKPFIEVYDVVQIVTEFATNHSSP